MSKPSRAKAYRDRLMAISKPPVTRATWWLLFLTIKEPKIVTYTTSKALWIALLAVSLYSETAGAQSYNPYSDDYVLSKDRAAYHQQEYGTSGGFQPYIALQYGYNDPVGNTREMDSGSSYSGAFGGRFDNYRLEAEVSYRNNDTDNSILGSIDTMELKNSVAMINLSYDFRNSSRFTPYIGGGIGASYGSAKINFDNGIDTLTADGDDIVFAYQVGGGLSFDITKSIALTMDYRYLDTGNYKLETVVNGIDVGHVDAGDYRSHEIRGGVRYSF